MKKLVPNLMVADMARSLAFYCDVLGFDLLMGVENEGMPPVVSRGRDAFLVFAMCNRGGVTIMLQTRASMAGDLPFMTAREPGASATLFIEVEDFSAVRAAIADKATVLLGPRDTWYGMRELYVADPDGYTLCFATRGM